MSTQIRTSNQSRASTKIVVGFVAILAALYIGKTIYDNRAIGNAHFAPLTPTRVNLVGVDTAKGGYHIIVANRIATLVQSASSSFDAPTQDNTQSDTDDSDTDKTRIPLKEMIQTMQGKPEAVGQYVAVLNDMKQEDMPAVEVIWSRDDILKALGGDKTLQAKLEADLNTKLDGTPLDVFRPKTFQTGIVIDLPISLTVPSVDGQKTVSGTLQYPFQTTLMKALEWRVKDESDLNDHTLAGYYAEVAKTFIDKPKTKQDVTGALKQITSQSHIDSLTELPQKVLASIQILANDSLIKSASYRPEDTPKGTVYNLDLNLTNEGRDRLWQYSRGKTGLQLLLVVDGVAVAAPQIGGELAQTQVTISDLPDELIVKDTVDKINSASKG